VAAAFCAGCHSSAPDAGQAAGASGGAGGNGTGGRAGDTGAAGVGGAAGAAGGPASAADGGVAIGAGCVLRAAGQWQLTSTSDEPPPQYPTGAGAVLWSGSALFVISYDRPGGKYDPCRDTWQPLAAYPGFSSLLLGTNDGAYFTDGSTLGQGPPQSFLFFDFTSLAWNRLSIAGYPTAGDLGGAVLMVGSRFVKWGGRAQNDGVYPLLTSTGATYDRATDRWQPMSTVGAPPERVVRGNVVDAGGRLFVWGGARTLPSNGQVAQGDPAAVALTQAPGLVCPDWDPYNCSYGNGALYDPATDTWTPVSDTGAPSARFDQLTAWTGTRVLVWGGARRVISNGALTELSLTDGALYDPATRSWTSTAAPPWQPRAPNASFSGGLMYLRDGEDAQSPTYAYDPATNRWAMAKPVPPAMPTRTGGPISPTIFWTGSYWIAFGGYRYGPTPPPCTPPAQNIGCDSQPEQMFVSEAAVALPAP
jgi:hypothetical protein